MTVKTFIINKGDYKIKLVNYKNIFFSVYVLATVIKTIIERKIMHGVFTEVNYRYCLPKTEKHKTNLKI